MNNIDVNKLFEQGCIIEDALDALDNNYYDTHNINEIRENEENDRKILNELRIFFNLKENQYFSNTKLINGKINNK